MAIDGWLVFLARWLLSARWRTEYEPEAFAAGIAAALPVDGTPLRGGDD
ncbi:hypothetical protein [Candidatus Palauibacter sp.]